MRRLGVGGGSGGDRPIRAPVIVAIVAGLLIIGVPLYLLRRPAGSAKAVPSASASAEGSALAASAVPNEPARIRIDPPQRVRCSSSPKRKGLKGNLCDRLPPLEKALHRAIKASVDCKPRVSPPEEGNINFVLRVDFRSKSYSVQPGKSGKWKGPQARRAAKCVQRRLGRVDFSMPHQYRYYVLAMLATYPIVPLPGLPGAQVFDER